MAWCVLFLSGTDQGLQGGLAAMDPVHVRGNCCRSACMLPCDVQSTARSCQLLGCRLCAAVPTIRH
jgi:hypothetical protein